MPNTMQTIQDGIHSIKINGSKRIATISRKDSSLHIWDPKRSKLGVMVVKKIPIPIGRDSRVLYLGASSGTTVSHVADIAKIAYAVEFSPRSMRDLLDVCKDYDNLIPLLDDANHPERYSPFVEPVDVIYQDVAQRNQAEIALLNAKWFLKDGGYLIITIKAKSIDTTANPQKILEAEAEKLTSDFKIISKTDLAPYHADHLAVIAQKLPQVAK